MTPSSARKSLDHLGDSLVPFIRSDAPLPARSEKSFVPINRRPTKRDMFAVSSWHEAAHAVVGVRLGMTLVSIDIKPRKLQGAYGKVAISCGYTSYELSTLIEQLGRTEAHRACAVFAAAGIVAEREHGDGDRHATADDVEGVVRHGTAAGISTADQAVFLAASVNQAAHLLSLDGGTAWLRVRSALRLQRSLSPARVEALVGQHG
jgi:hypothetical protein